MPNHRSPKYLRDTAERIAVGCIGVMAAAVIALVIQQYFVAGILGLVVVPLTVTLCRRYDELADVREAYRNIQETASRYRNTAEELNNKLHGITGRVSYSFTTSGLQGRKGIKCHTCGMISWNPRDVENLYCANCQVFHEEES